MAKQANSRLIGVAVAPEEGDILEAQAIIRRMLSAASLAGVPMKGVNPQGVAADTGIVQQAIKHEVDLIIAGQLRAHRVEETPHGECYRTGYRRLPLPVLVVNSRAEGGRAGQQFGVEVGMCEEARDCHMKEHSDWGNIGP